MDWITHERIWDAIDVNAFAAAGAGFLIAVLWFDLMFDVQTLGHSGEVLPSQVLNSISAYYCRVTTDARPMGHLVAVVMIMTIAAIGGEIAAGSVRWWIAWPSLAATLAAVSLTRMQTLKNAVLLGSAAESADMQARRARAILRDHLFCLAAMCLVVGLQLSA